MHIKDTITLAATITNLMEDVWDKRNWLLDMKNEHSSVLLNYRVHLNDTVDDIYLDVHVRFIVTPYRWYATIGESIEDRDLIFHVSEADHMTRFTDRRRYGFSGSLRRALKNHFDVIKNGFENELSFFLWDTFPIETYNTTN